MFKLDYAEFYITNVCNLNCTNCNRFNNFNFTGHELWAEHAKDYAQWASLIDVNRIGILGGEPMLNPSFIDWVTGVADLWPRAEITIITNGTQLGRWPNLYDTLVKYKGRVQIGISEHNFSNKKTTLSNIENFLQKSFTTKLNDSSSHGHWRSSYNNVRDASWPDCNTPEDFVNLPQHIQDECENVFHISLKIWQDEIYGIDYVDENQVKVRFSHGTSFYNTTVIHNEATGELRLNNSDPEKAISICYSKKCHHFIKGKLYKCGPVGILPEFIQQFNVDITDEDRNLINSYQPAELSWDNKNLSSFIQDLTDEKAIPQCKFCPDSFTTTKCASTTKKIKLVKRQR